MLSSLPLFVLLALRFTSVALAAPLPQDIATNAPAGPPMRTTADLDADLGDLVIPQEEHSNSTASAITKIRSAPPDFATLVDEIGDFQIPSDATAGSIARAAK